MSRIYPARTVAINKKSAVLLVRHLLLCARDLLHAECDELVQLPPLLLLALILDQRPHKILHMHHAHVSTSCDKPQQTTAIINARCSNIHWTAGGPGMASCSSHKYNHSLAFSHVASVQPRDGARCQKASNGRPELASAALRASQQCFSASAAPGATRKDDARPEDASADCPLSAWACPADACCAAAASDFSFAAASCSALCFSSAALLAASSACLHNSHLLGGQIMSPPCTERQAPGKAPVKAIRTLQSSISKRACQ